MRVGFGCTLLAQGLNHAGVDGIGAYTLALGQQLSAKPELELKPVSFAATFTANFPFPQAQIYPGYAPMAVIAAVSKCRFAGNDRLKQEIDLFHATDHLVPRYTGFPVVATLMDAVPLAHPEWIRQRWSRLKGKLWRHAAHWADHIITISEYSKADIVRYFGISPDKITVTPLGVDQRYFERIESGQKAAIIKQLGLPERFYLFVGTLQPRKNLVRLLDAHALLPLSLQKEVPLVIVGRAGWGCETLVARLRDPDLTGRVYWLQYLPDLQVRALMQTALALVFPSLYEGFGLPVVEAFASRLPVITSNTTALPEVALNAAILVDPLETGAISDAMRQLVAVSGIAASLVAAGFQRAHQLNWTACADKTLAVYQQVLTNK